MNRTIFLLPIFALSLALFACGSSDDDGTTIGQGAGNTKALSAEDGEKLCSEMCQLRMDCDLDLSSQPQCLNVCIERARREQSWIVNEWVACYTDNYSCEARELGSHCGESSDCNSNICVDSLPSRCSQECQNNPDCPDGYRCDDTYLEGGTPTPIRACVMDFDRCRQLSWGREVTPTQTHLDWAKRCRERLAECESDSETIDDECDIDRYEGTAHRVRLGTDIVKEAMSCFDEPCAAIEACLNTHSM